MNAIMLPVVLGFIYRLAHRELPEDLRLRGVYAIAVAIVFSVIASLGLYASAVSIIH